MIDLIDLHTHTIACGHAYNTLYEMAQSASEKGLALFGSSDHAPAMPGSCHEYYFTNFRVIPRVLYRMPILMGAELNILDFDGQVDLPPDILKKMDYAIASIHIQCIAKGTAADYTRAYVKAMENPLIHIIGHPDDSRLPADYDTLAAAARETHTLLEINNSSLRPGSIRIGAKDNCARLLERCAHYGASVIMGSDAHCEADAGNHRYAIELLEELQFPEDLIVNTSLDRAASFLPCLAARLDEPLLRAREADARLAPSHSAAADEPSVGGGMEK